MKLPVKRLKTRRISLGSRQFYSQVMHSDKMPRQLNISQAAYLLDHNFKGK